MTRFLYLFQVEQELPANLRGAYGPESDVRFLSYRAPSTDPRQLFYPSSSWTQGRNRLLREFHEGDWTYLIFGDGDIRLELTRRGSADRAQGQDPWREFERFLLEYEPAVGTPAYAWHLSGRWDLDRDVQPLRFFDPVLNAFHRESLLTLLPYFDLLDEESEDYAGSIVGSLAADLYPGQVLQTNRVQVINPLSLRRSPERHMTKPETLFLGSLRDQQARSSFRRQPDWRRLRHQEIGMPRRWTTPYHRTEAELAARYELDHPIWSRRRALLEMPTDHSFYSGDITSERALRWRSRDLGPAIQTNDLLRSLVPRWRALRQLRRRLIAATVQWRRLLQRPRRMRAAAFWRGWVLSKFRPLIVIPERLDHLDVISHALDRLSDAEVILVDVGTGSGEALEGLQNRVTHQKPVISIGVDAVATKGFSDYAGYVLGRVDQELMSLQGILEQYGLADRTLHWVRIAEGDVLATFRTLGDRARHCLFLTARCAVRGAEGSERGTSSFPVVHSALESDGFRLLIRSSDDSLGHIEATFVNHALAQHLLPELIP